MLQLFVTYCIACPGDRFFTQQTFFCATQRSHAWLSDALLPYLQPRKQTFLGLNQFLKHWEVSTFTCSMRSHRTNDFLIPFLCLWKSLRIGKHNTLHKPWHHHSITLRLLTGCSHTNLLGLTVTRIMQKESYLVKGHRFPPGSLWSQMEKILWQKEILTQGHRGNALEYCSAGLKRQETT